MAKSPKPVAKKKQLVSKRPAATKQLEQVRKRPSSAEEAVLPDWYGDSDEQSQLQVYLVTAAKLVDDNDHVENVGELKPPPLRDPATVSKLEFRTALQDNIANPIYEKKRGGRPPTRTLDLEVYVGVKEGEPEEQHHHAALKLFEAQHRFLPFKLAMRWRHQIATHWSTSHTQLWSAVRYVHCTTTHKRVVDRKPELWARDGRKLNLHAISQEPFQARAWNQHRESMMSEPFGKKSKKESFSKLDFSAAVLAHRLLTPSAVLAYVFEKGTKTMQLWVHCRQRKLKEFIQEALEMERAKAAVASENETEWALIERLSRGTCSCGDDGCLWWSLASEFFKNNTQIDKERLAASLRKVICMGPCKEARVPTIIGKPNCAKSTVLDPTRNVFGKEYVLGKPKLGAPNGALSRLAKGNVRFIYFDDYRPVEYATYPKENPTVPVTDFLALFCGQPLNIQVSQSFNDGHPSMEYHKGAAMTAKEDGLWTSRGDVTGEEIRHMQARVEIFRATHVVGEDPDDFDCSPACAESWCRWIVVDSVAYANRQAPRSFPGRAPRRQPRMPAALPPLMSTQPSKTKKVSAGGVTAQQEVEIAQKREAAVRRKVETQRRAGEVTAQQKVKMAQNREEAVRRKRAHQRQKPAALPLTPSDDEDPLGHGCSLDVE